MAWPSGLERGPGTCVSRTSSTARPSPRSSVPRARDLRHPRLRCEAAPPALRRPALPRCEHLGAIRSRGTECGTDVVLGTRFATKPLELKIPGHDRRHELRRAVGSGQGGSRPRSDRGRNLDDDRRRRHDERGARALAHARLPAASLALRDEPGRPETRGRDRGRGGRGRETGWRRDARSRKISDRVAEMRDLPKGIDQRSASRHPDWTGPDDLEIKIHELREITDWEKPIFVKVGATRTYYDVQLAVKAGADVIVVERHAGRHRRDPGRLHRARRDSDASGDEDRGRRLAGARDAPEGAAHRLRRHPERG